MVDSERSLRGLAVVGLGGAWAALALAETVLGDLDALADLPALTDSSGRVVAAGLLHVLSGALLAVGLVGIGPVAWVSRVGGTGVALCGVLAPCLGAFGMLHLLAAEMAVSRVDPDALQGFLVERLGGFGPWAAPVAVVAVGGGWLLAVLLGALARLGLAPWWAVAVVAAGALLHMLRGDGPLEYLSHWVVALGMVAGTTAYARRRPARAAPEVATSERS